MSNLLELSSLQEVMPQTSADRLAHFVYPLSVTIGGNVDFMPLEQAHFIAQLAHESGGFKYLSENLNYSQKALRTVFSKYFRIDDIAAEYARKPRKIANRVYANRMGNGDEASGDGWKYRGRGLIQLTGKENYQKCSEFLDFDLVNWPEMLSADIMLSVKSALWFWESRKLSTYARDNDIETITRRINGGLNGLDDRKKYLARCKSVLGLEE